MVTGLLHPAAIALYAAASLLLGLALARGVRRLPAVATLTAAAAAAAHVGALAVFTERWQELPLVGLGPSLSTLGLLIGAGALAVAALGRTSTLGLFLLPVAAVVTAAAQWVGVEPAGEVMHFRGPWFALHVILAMAGYAGLTVAFAAGAMYLLQFRQLKTKRFGAVFRFSPPLATLERVGRAALLAGFPLLTLALALGWAWSERFGTPLRAGNPKVVWGVLTWLVFAAALAARALPGERSHRGALAAVFGFGVVVVSYVLLRLAATGGGFL